MATERGVLRLEVGTDQRYYLPADLNNLYLLCFTVV